MNIGCTISALAWTTATALAALGSIPVPAWAASPVPAASTPLAVGQQSQAGAPAPAGAPPAAVPGLFPERADDSFVESIEVSVVSIDVVVRDRSGKQATGLTRDDFALFVDGQKVEITNFYALGNGARQPAETPAAAADAGSVPKRERLNLVIYVDNANLHPFDRNRILKQLRSFLEHTLGPEDQVLLVTHDLGLQVRHAFRDSPGTLGAALDKLEKETARGVNQDLATRQTMEQIQQLGCRQIDSAQAMARAYADAVFAEVKMTYASLYHLLESLGGMDGRKVLLYVGDGVATQVGTDVFGQVEEMCGHVNQFADVKLDATAPLRQVVATANANLVTFYTLEATGLRSYVSAEHSRPLVSFQLSRMIDADRQDSLTSLARETGGRAALNGNDFTRDLEEIAAELGGGYSLGFTPLQPGDGKAHQLKVELKRPGLRASYRQSYRDRSAAERLEGQVEAALIHGYADNPLAASLKLGTASPSEHGRVLVPVQVRVPFGKLAFVPREDGRHGRVSIFVGNMDARGGMSAIQRVQLPLRIPEADLKRVLASHLGYDVKLLLAPGRQRIAFAVRDDVARVSASVIQELDIDNQGHANVVAATPAGSR
ncbi:MAG TPA: VWA domain-containing protein [Thermoanaerobaculia bacterium]|nr:VWA domain-containing protein [Thermoanaerobaculia bacterium]